MTYPSPAAGRYLLHPQLCILPCFHVGTLVCQHFAQVRRSGWPDLIPTQQQVRQASTLAEALAQKVDSTVGQAGVRQVETLELTRISLVAESAQKVHSG